MHLLMCRAYAFARAIDKSGSLGPCLSTIRFCGILCQGYNGIVLEIAFLAKSFRATT